MAELTTKKRNKMSDSSFAYVDDSGEGHLSVNDAAHTRNALSRFNQTHFESPEDKAAAARKIQAAAAAGVPVALVVTANDSDPDDPLTLKEVRQPRHGTATCAPVDPQAFRPQWRCVYAPAPGFVGTDDFAYAIADPSGETSTATVRVVVAPAPTATRTPTATPTPAGPPRASDGQHLGLQSAAGQDLYRATHGAEAEARWLAEHEAELAGPSRRSAVEIMLLIAPAGPPRPR